MSATAHRRRRRTMHGRAEDPYASVAQQREANEQLATEMALQARRGKRAGKSSLAEQIAAMQRQSDVYAQKIHAERRVLEISADTRCLRCAPSRPTTVLPHVHRKIAELRERIMKQRQQIGGVNAPQENNELVAKQIRVLENKVEKAVVKYNQTLAENKRLKEDINGLRRERVVFDSVYSKLEKDLEEKRHELARIAQLANEAYEQRDAAQTKLMGLRQQVARERMEFEDEWRMLGKRIEADRERMFRIEVSAAGGDEHIAEPGSPPTQLTSASASTRRRRDSVGSDSGATTPHGRQDGDAGTAGEQEQGPRGKAQRTGWSIEQDKAALRAAQQTVRDYEQAFARIREATGVADVDELVRRFTEAEEKNFSLLTHSNQLSEEIERMEAQIAEAETEVERYRGLGAHHDNQRKRVVHELQERLRRTEDKIMEYESRAALTAKTTSALKSGVQALFTKLGCETSSLSAMLGSQPVTEVNIMQYLGVIEQRANELLRMFVTHCGEGQDAGAAGLALPGGPAAPARAATLAVKPPALSDALRGGGDSDEEDQRPMTRKELEQQMARALRSSRPSDSGATGGSGAGEGEGSPAPDSASGVLFKE